MQNVEAGQILDGRVKGIKNFGAFVELPNGESGLVHISQVSSSYVENIEDYLAEGQEVKVKVLDVFNEIESGKKKISLSIRQAEASQTNENQYNGLKKGQGEPKRVKVFNKGERPKSNNFEDMMAKFKRESDEKMSDISQRLDGF